MHRAERTGQAARPARRVPASSGAERVDGRSARAARTRDAVVGALLELFEAGELRPGAARIAERAGVSLRSVFEHFQDLEALRAATAERQIARVLGALEPVAMGGALPARIDAFVAARARIHERIAPVRRAALLHEPFSAVIARRLRWARAQGRRQLAQTFAPELAARSPADRAELLAALDVASGWSSWEALRRGSRLSVPRASAVVARLLRALLEED